MPSKRTKSKDPDYEKLGRMVSAIYEFGYIDKKKLYLMSFVKGLFAGLGGVIGATILAALIIWVLSLFSSVPLIGHFSEKVRSTIETSQQ